jgi:hypothetical protein
MKTLKITKIETDNDFSSVTFAGGAETDGTDFDLSQLGTDIVYINAGFGSVDVAGTVTLKVGDSITDEFGGEPVLGAVRKDATHKNMSIFEHRAEDAMKEKLGKL